MDGMWQFIVVGSAGAIGAALALGTLAALVRWYRTGEWPGDTATEVGTARLVGLWLRVIVGVVVAVWAFASLSRAGLLGL
ncbi:hypothetical protein [Salsipaludibacter albus]|uniref:hypothetical protein n=1 Tax=Salsipaludibacter albus TaxID=2849650 RepID=UPI001EE46841|nr:hypothetical protein [Salsipaludibacter albus]MBY5162407.1 hypothetical protein [Salsipaludibacter albus]